MANILITGGAGFIGSHVADAYIQAGHQVTIVDNLSTGKEEFLNPKASFFQADITDRKSIEKIINEVRPEIINHHAAHIQVGNSVLDPQFDAQSNILGLLNIMQAAKNVGTNKIIMASTGGAMYGNQQTPFREDMEAMPLSPYGVSKRSGELYLNYFYEQFGIAYTILRYANVYGPRQNPHGESGVVAIFSEFLSEGKNPIINGDGTNTRDYVFVSDVVSVNVKSLNNDFVGILNIGTGIETSTNQVFKKVVASFGVEIPENHGEERPGEQKVSALSSEKAKQVLDWSPMVDFDTGVSLVTDWYKNNQKTIEK
jgi:UDP-glucose 4-epimerase